MSGQVFWYPNAAGSYDETGTEGDEYSLDEPQNPWDRCSIGPYTLPGWVKVKVRRNRKLDIKKPPGEHGATMTDQGYNPAEVEIVLTCKKPSQWKSLQDWWLTFEPLPGKKAAEPLDIIHPATSMRNVKSVLIEDIEGPTEGTVKGTMVFTFKCKEWFPAPVKNATNTPKKSIQPRQNALTGDNEFVGPPSPTKPSTAVVAPPSVGGA